MKKSKEKDIDILDFSGKDNKKKKKVKDRKNASTEKSKNDVFDFDNEIVIGITKKEDKPKEKDKNSNNKKKSKKQKKQNKEKIKKEEKKTSTKTVKLIKFLVLFIIIVGAIVFFMLSPIFNIKTVTVTGNSKLTSEEIISLSEITTDINTFRIRTGQVENRLKQNAYIESVKISRKLPSEIVIEVNERVAKYMLEFVNSVVYVNNQGYMLEITEEKIPVPFLTGINTPMEEFKEGNRLNKEDLQKMETVIKIMDTLESYGLSNLVTKINIADKKNYILNLDEEGKIVYLGNASNINTRIMYLKEILEREKGINSEIFINGDINKDDVYTREMV